MRGAVRRAGSDWGPAPGRHAAPGFSLIELLCVIAIIAILVSLLLPTVFRVYSRVRAMAEESEADVVQRLLLRESRGYCEGNPNYSFDDKLDFANKCNLAPKCRDWMQKRSTEFVPFTYLTSTNVIVLTVHLGPKQAITYSFNKGELTTRPPQQ